MEARENNFKSIVTNENRLDIPFFQRHYTWNEEHWERLFDDLYDSFINNTTHFVGSVILKRNGGNDNFAIVIDGQQRLTTFSILLKVLYDKIDESERKHFENCLFETYKDDSPKINHSKIDREKYTSLFNNEIDTNAKEGIFGCYNYFNTRTESKSNDELFEFMKFICETKIFVLVTLNANEDEQKIFDSINSTGAPLNASDIIKNALFDKAIKINNEEWALKIYEKYWESVFEKDDEMRKFWITKIGKDARTRSENLLHSFALIKGFFDSQKDKLSELSLIYKTHISSLENKKDLESFLNEIKVYANIYSEFPKITKQTFYKFDDFKSRLFHILNISDIMVFIPVVLYIFKTKDLHEQEQMCKVIETLVMRFYITHKATNGFNKLLSEMLKKAGNKDSLIDFINNHNSFRLPSNNEMCNKLKTLWDNGDNKRANLILFWIELFRRSKEQNTKDIVELADVYTLEHLMPQSWEENWHQYANNDDEADELIYQIGNMTILKGSLNSSLKNKDWETKLNGDGKLKNCIKRSADLIVNKELLDKKAWNKDEIEKRTKILSDNFLEIWSIK